MQMKNCVLIAGILTGMAATVANGAPEPVASAQTFGVNTKDFSVDFQVGNDGRLYQFPIGSGDPKSKLKRDDESYPQAGDGYVWEPALEIVHADGNTSTALLCNGLTRVDESGDRELTRVRLHDPAYPCEVTVCFRAHRD